MRKLTILYRIAYGRAMFAEKGEYESICQMIATLRADHLITDDEYVLLKADIKKNRPREFKHLELAAKKSYDWDGALWYPPGKWKHRLRFLHKMIKYSKPWYFKIYYLWKGQLK